jgi:Bacterial PH domain
MHRPFAIEPISQPAFLSLAGIVGFCLVLAAILAWQSRLEPSLWLFTFLMVAIAALFSWFIVGQQHSALVISPQGLALKAPLYGRTIPLPEIQVDQIELITLDRQSPYRLTWRTNGLSVPGYQLGWFRTKARGTVLAAITGDQVMAIPTTKGYTLLVSMQDPQQVLTQLRT